MLFLLILGHFLCSVAGSITFSSNLSNFEEEEKMGCTKGVQKVNKNLQK